MKNLTTTEAAEYLTGLGIRTAPMTMILWRHYGRGPKYKKIHRNVYYTPEMLESFAEGKEMKKQVVKTGWAISLPKLVLRCTKCKRREISFDAEYDSQKHEITVMVSKCRKCGGETC
jgi:hypothetical protein